MQAHAISADDAGRPTTGALSPRLLPLLFLCLATWSTVAGAADGADTSFLVRVVVAPKVVFQVVAQPARLNLTAEDIALGYKDARASYDASYGPPRGWLLHMAPRVGLTERIEVTGLPHTVVIGREPVFAHLDRPTGSTRLDLEFRFYLAPDAEPGSYDFPLFVTAAEP